MVADSAKEAVQNARAVNTYATGYCQKYVRDQCWRVPSLYGSAIDAWNGAKHKHPGDRHPPKGAPCYYRGGQYGHVVIFADPPDDHMRGTDMPSTGRVSEEAISWIETYWGYEYLGWTGDLNGVLLPLDTEDDEMNESDWQRLQGMLDATVEKVWNEHIEVTKPSGEKEEKKARQVIKETWQEIKRSL